MANPNDDAELLALVHATAAEARRTGRASGFCKFNRVLQGVAAAREAAGEVVPAGLAAMLVDEQVEWTEAVYDWYLRFVAMVVDGRFVEGQGNYGDVADDCPPAHPKFLECRLTEAGRELVERD